MKHDFADTAYWVALVNRDDELHAAAHHWNRSVGDRYRLHTSELVFVEFLNYLSSRGSVLRTVAATLVGQLYRNPQLEIVLLRHIDLEAGMALYSQRQDKEWSIVDCSSFLIIKQQGIMEALTADHHFEQAGFVNLLR